MHSHTALYDTNLLHHTAPCLLDLWVEGISPLVIEVFVIYVWSTPLTTNILQTSYSSDIKIETVFILFVLALLTFALNVCIYPYLTTIHDTTNISHSPLFRSVWTFTCAVFIRMSTGIVGIIPLTILVFLPLIYVRVPRPLASISAIYAVIFFGVCAIDRLLSTRTEYSEKVQRVTDTTPVFYNISMNWIIFVANSVHHMTWISSHAHTSDRSRPPIVSYFFLRWRHSAIPIAIFRTLVVLFCTAFACVSKTHQENQSFILVGTLFFFTTISTLTAWVHCQHENVTSLRAILLASVTTAVCGMLADSMEQTTFLYMLLPAAICVELVLAHRHTQKLHSE
jgi:hypothetical protein